MSPASRQPSREDVLDAFAMEPDSDRATLERYLRAYPTYADDLISLSRELNREQGDEPILDHDRELIEAAWRRHAEVVPARTAADPLVALSATDVRAIADQLDVPLQVVAAFRERRVLLGTVPRGFLARLAKAMGSSLERLEQALTGPPALATARSYKATSRPVGASPVSFERVLQDARVSPEKRAQLLADTD